MDTSDASQPQRARAHAIAPARWPTAEEARASALFAPGAIGPLRTRTRTWVPAMVPWRASSEGFVTPEVLEWYGRFADGQPGVLVVEATGIREVPSGPLLRIGHDRFVPGLRSLTELVRARSHGRTRLFVQLIDFLQIRRRPEPATYFARYLKLADEHRARLASLPGRAELAAAPESQLRAALAQLARAELEAVLTRRELEELDYGARERVNDTQLAHIADLPRTLPPLFAAATARAVEAGFDGVELHFAHAYTLASFLSRTNERSDGYGGSSAGRLRLPLEVIAAARARIGAQAALGCRYLSDEVIEGGSRLADALEYAQAFAAAGLDFLSLSKGGKFDDARQPRIGEAAYPYTGPSGHECMPTVRIDAPGETGPFGRNLPAAAAIRRRLRELGHATPVVGCGGINTFELAERALREGACDYVGAARQTLADPDWFLKLELGRGDEVRRCIYTNYCEALDQKHVPVTCQLWDRDFSAPDAGASAASAPAAVRRTPDGKRRLAAPAWTPR